MVRVSASMHLSVDEVIRRAVAFFGPGGTGLRVMDSAPGRARFEGGGGSVAVEVRPATGGAEVIVEAWEWEADARRFLREI
jgi:hypothetical protein